MPNLLLSMPKSLSTFVDADEHKRPYPLNFTPQILKCIKIWNLLRSLSVPHLLKDSPTPPNIISFIATSAAQSFPPSVQKYVIVVNEALLCALSPMIRPNYAIGALLCQYMRLIRQRALLPNFLKKTTGFSSFSVDWGL